METATRGQLAVEKTDLLGSRLGALIASSGMTESAAHQQFAEKCFAVLPGSAFSGSIFYYRLLTNCAEHLPAYNQVLIHDVTVLSLPTEFQVMQLSKLDKNINIWASQSEGKQAI